MADDSSPRLLDTDVANRVPEIQHIQTQMRGLMSREATGHEVNPGQTAPKGGVGYRDFTADAEALLKGVKEQHLGNTVGLADFPDTRKSEAIVVLPDAGIVGVMKTSLNTGGKLGPMDTPEIHIEGNPQPNAAQQDSARAVVMDALARAQGGGRGR